MELVELIIIKQSIYILSKTVLTCYKNNVTNTIFSKT